MFFQLSALAGLLSLASALPQGPNTVAANNPDVRTMAANGTWFLVPVPSATVQAAVPYSLLPVPVTNTTLFPNGFPADTHPVLVANEYSSDIRLIALGLSLQIDALLAGSVYVPYVDRLSNGVTPFNYGIPGTILIGGTDGMTLESVEQAIAPSLVGSLTGGQPIVDGAFLPIDAAWQENAPGQYSASASAVLVPNPVTGPAVQYSIYEFLFSTATDPLYTFTTFHEVINQPIILETGQCLRNTIYFNESFADQTLRTGSVNLYANPLPSGFAALYSDVGGFSAQGENIGYNNQDCAQAAADVPAAATN